MSLKYVHALELQEAAAKFNLRQILKIVSTAPWAAWGDKLFGHAVKML